jgi:hypothetical protein
MATWPGWLRTWTTPQSAITHPWAHAGGGTRMPRSDHACYVCGALPKLVDATAFGDTESQFIAAGWLVPGEDHEHASRPPTPEELAAAGHASLRRILEAS